MSKMSDPSSRYLTGKVVLISGVGQGLGKSAAQAVLAAGGSVVLGDLVGTNLTKTAAGLDTEGNRVAYAQADIRDRKACEELVALARTRFGRLDAVVNVAAHSNVVGGLMDGDLDGWDLVAAVNVKGTLQMTKAAVPLLTASGGGSIIFIGSIAAIHSVDGIPQIAYGASKAGLVAATHYLAHELGPDGIRVNTIAPGWKWGAVLEDGYTQRAEELGLTVEELMEPVRQGHPLRRITNDDEVSNTIVFFCSDLAPSITGQVLYIDGGLTA
jgi:NAD(P)-dependent dehydrogenase (short-subunit alcohol dehydrogenase family)